MIQFIIFSKDRAAQLELLLHSMKEQFGEWKDFPISVIYKASDSEFEKGYEVVKKLYPEVEFVREIMNHESRILNLVNKHLLKTSDFKKLTLSSVSSENTKYLAFLVDDIFIKDKFSVESPEFKELENNKEILCLSLRMSPHINYSYANDQNLKVPEFEGDLNIWKWAGQDGDWAYPMSVDGHIFRREDIVPILEKIYFNNPNLLESMLTRYRDQFEDRKMICFEKSILVNNPTNIVQTAWKNRSGSTSPKEINEIFLEGKRLKYSHLIGVENNSPHVEFPLVWE